MKEIIVEITEKEVFTLNIEEGGGSCSSTLHYTEDNYKEGFDTRAEWHRYEAAIDILESLVLAHAIEGIDVTSEQYRNGLKTAIEGMANAVL